MKRKKTGIWMRAVIVCCLAVLSLGGCGKKTDQTVSDADVQQAGEDSGKETGKANKSLTDQGSAYLGQKPELWSMISAIIKLPVW